MGRLEHFGVSKFHFIPPRKAEIPHLTKLDYFIIELLYKAIANILVELYILTATLARIRACIVKNVPTILIIVYVDGGFFFL